MNQGEIWLIELDPTVGAEMKKSRPAIIINTDTLGKLPLKIIAPITDWKEHYNEYPWMVKLISTEKNGLEKESCVDCFQIRSLSVERFAICHGTVEPDIIFYIQDAITKVIGAS